MKSIATGCSVHTANKQLKMTPTNERFAQLLYSSTAKIILIISFGIAIIIRLLFCVLPGLSLSLGFLPSFSVAWSFDLTGLAVSILGSTSVFLWSFVLLSVHTMWFLDSPCMPLRGEYSDYMSMSCRAARLVWISRVFCSSSQIPFLFDGICMSLSVSYMGYMSLCCRLAYFVCLSRVFC